MDRASGLIEDAGDTKTGADIGPAELDGDKCSEKDGRRTQPAKLSQDRFQRSLIVAIGSFWRVHIRVSEFFSPQARPPFG